MKVAQLAGYVSEQTAYHHGEASLHSTIVHMAQNFPGSNNVPLLYPAGQFGTRYVFSVRTVVPPGRDFHPTRDTPLTDCRAAKTPQALATYLLVWTQRLVCCSGKRMITCSTTSMKTGNRCNRNTSFQSSPLFCSTAAKAWVPYPSPLLSLSVVSPPPNFLVSCASADHVPSRSPGSPKARAGARRFRRTILCR